MGLFYSRGPPPTRFYRCWNRFFAGPFRILQFIFLLGSLDYEIHTWTQVKQYVCAKPLVGEKHAILWYLLGKNRFLLAVPTEDMISNKQTMVGLIKSLLPYELENYRHEIQELDKVVSEDILRAAGFDALYNDDDEV